MNLKVEHFFERLSELGIQDYCLCTGSRNSALLAALAASEGFTIWHFVDEREAAFFALGRMKATGSPVAVVTTSGTAVAELFPAVIEAYYQELPLVCITADRPSLYRGTGAPQSIDQVKIFSDYADYVEWDFSKEGKAPKLPLSDKPLQINAIFDEPLLTKEFLAKTYEPLKVIEEKKYSLGVSAAAQEISKFLASAKNPLILVSELNDLDQSGVKAFLLRAKMPVYLESLSGIKFDAALAEHNIMSSDRILSLGDFDSVLRIGGVPTLRFWRDLEQKYLSIRVMSLSDRSFSGSPRSRHLMQAVTPVLEACRVEGRDYQKDFFKLDREFLHLKKELIYQEKNSEPSMVYFLSKILPSRSQLFLGNSLPIREWDLCAAPGAKDLHFRANRGANGIDGLLSTFLGGLDPERDNWCLVGDLSALYSWGAFWVREQLEGYKFQIWVLNNGGGKIFSRLPHLKNFMPAKAREDFVELKHNLDFRSGASFWNLGFESFEEFPPHLPGADQGIVELKPNAEATENFWRKYDQLWETM